MVWCMVLIPDSQPSLLILAPDHNKMTTEDQDGQDGQYDQDYQDGQDSQDAKDD